MKTKHHTFVFELQGLARLIDDYLKHRADPEDKCIWLQCSGLNAQLLQVLLHFIYCGDFEQPPPTEHEHLRVLFAANEQVIIIG